MRASCVRHVHRWGTGCGVRAELKSVRNMRPSAHGPLGMWGAFIYAGAVHYITGGREPFTLSHGGDELGAHTAHTAHATDWRQQRLEER